MSERIEHERDEEYLDRRGEHLIGEEKAIEEGKGSVTEYKYVPL